MNYIPPSDRRWTSISLNEPFIIRKYELSPDLVTRTLYLYPPFINSTDTL